MCVLGAFPGRNIAEVIDCKPDCPLLIEQGRRLDRRPATLAIDRTPKAQHQIGGWYALERPASRQVLRRKRLASLVHDLKLSQDVGGRGVPQVLSVSVPEDARRRVICIVYPAIEILHDHAIRDAPDDCPKLVSRSGELLLGACALLYLLLCQRIQPRVIERDGGKLREPAQGLDIVCTEGRSGL